MSRRMVTRVLFCALVVASFVLDPALAQTPLGTTFTYQGQLKSGGSPANGSFSMDFKLWNDPTLSASANQVGGAVTIGAVPVANGLFTVKLNSSSEFGLNAFDGNKRWLEIAVNGTTLSPRQELTVAPYAQFAQLAARPWSTSATDTYFTGGNVGIGTSTIFPARRLESNASSTNAIAVYAENNTPALGLPTLYATNLGGGAAAYFANGDVLLSSGKIGIGTNTPTAKLEVAGAAGTDGIKFPDGTLQTTAASGGGSAGKLVASGEFGGAFFGSINNPGAIWQFYGPTSSVTIAAGQRLQVIASAALGISGNTTTFDIDVGYQLQPAGAVTAFSGGNFMTTRIVNGSRNICALNGHATGLGAGTYTIGVVIRSTAFALNDNDFGNISYMVFNAP